ncbi:Na+/H+-dicarboxylate symporter [Desulfitispora alkaliphila]|uniref:dicarboxylate/amino acid:cation symporter n=1 Tax=Desulfitispora alkaliphila TaxID=622674 RepID=UPI003D2519CD
MKLIPKLILGIVVGIIIGLAAPEFFARLLITFKEIFGQLIGFAIPLIIIFFIVSGVASIGKQSGRIVASTAGIAYSSTVLAGTLAYVMAIIFIPMFTTSGGEVAKGVVGLDPFFKIEVAPLVGVMTALVTAFVFGIGIAKTESSTMKNFFDEGKKVIELLIVKVIIPILPIYIAGIFTELAAEGTVFETLATFGVVLMLAVFTHWVWLIIQYSIAGAFTGKSTFGALKTMLPAYFTALGTMSSAATIPVTLRQAKANKVREEVADFAVPLSATIHLSGSTITLTLCAVAVMVMSSGLSMPGFLDIMPFILMLGVVMVAAPGVPGGAVMAALGLLTTMLGFTETALGLMIALYMAQDSFGTAANVTGDGAIAMLVDKIAK